MGKVKMKNAVEYMANYLGKKANTVKSVQKEKEKLKNEDLGCSAFKKLKYYDFVKKDEFDGHGWVITLRNGMVSKINYCIYCGSELNENGCTYKEG